MNVSAHRRQKRVSDPLELDFQAVEGHCVGTENQTQCSVEECVLVTLNC